MDSAKSLIVDGTHLVLVSGKLEYYKINSCSSSGIKTLRKFCRTVCDSLIMNHRVPKDSRPPNSCCCPSVDEGISSSTSSTASCDHECVEIIIPEFDFLIGSRLFELYLALQKFYATGKNYLITTTPGFCFLQIQLGPIL